MHACIWGAAAPRRPHAQGAQAMHTHAHPLRRHSVSDFQKVNDRIPGFLPSGVIAERDLEQGEKLQTIACPAQRTRHVQRS